MDEKIKVSKLLLVPDPWASQLLSGFKEWEIRGRPLSDKMLTTIAIAKSREKGVNRIYGLVDLVNCKGPLTLKEMADNLEKHRDVNDTLTLPYDKTYAWVVANPRVLKKPLDYKYKNGWVIWGSGVWEFSSVDFVKEGKYITMPGPDPILRTKFLDSLADDLSFFGYSLGHSTNDGRSLSTIHMPNFREYSDDNMKMIMREGYIKIQDKNRENQREFVEEAKCIINDKELFANKPCKLDRLNPVIKRVTTQEEKKIHNYLRMLQNIPSSKSIGRVCDLIVYHEPDVDAKHEHKHILGIVGLGSSGYSSGGRDKLFGWINNSNFTKSQIQIAKQSALRSILQINCVLVAPPYDNSRLRISKLLSMAVFSEEIVTYYKEKFDSSMLCAISTAGFSRTAPLFDRISIGDIKKHFMEIRNGSGVPVNQINISRKQSDAFKLWVNPYFGEDSRKKYKNCVFYMEAETSQICTNIVSERTKELAKDYCNSSGATTNIRSLKTSFLKALNISGINESIFAISPRGIYVGLLDNFFIITLSSGRTADVNPYCIPWIKWVSHWKNIENNRLNK
jgi:hypothetical protein